jgi:DNA polymerase III alpha subunit
VPGIRLVPHEGELYDVWDLPEVTDVFRDICSGKTETVFQFDTPGAKKWMKNFDHPKPDGTPALNSIEG